jgi:hypothetical protein
MVVKVQAKASPAGSGGAILSHGTSPTIIVAGNGGIYSDVQTVMGDEDIDVAIYAGASGVQGGVPIPNYSGTIKNVKSKNGRITGAALMRDKEKLQAKLRRAGNATAFELWDAVYPMP